MTRPPHVLMLVTDNQAVDALGCYGNREHETPHIDRLAREGMRFTNAFCTNGTCSPARASILTGLMPSQHGVHLAIPDDPPLPKPDDYDVTREFRTLPRTLRTHGYRTGMVGKWHLGNPHHVGGGFEHWVALTTGHTSDFYRNTVIEHGEEREVVGPHIVDYFTDEAVDFLDGVEGDDRPFFLQVNYDGPYVLPPTIRGADRRNRFYERFEGRYFAPFGPIHPKIVESLILPFDPDLPPDEEYTLAGAVNAAWWMTRIHNDPATRANVAAQNALVDDGVGRVLGALEERALADDTLVILTTDQGNPYGQNGLWGHPPLTNPPFMFDVTFRVPLLARHPGVIPENRVCDRLVSHYDLYATVCDHLGIVDAHVPESPGASFAPVLRGGTVDDGRDAVFFEVETARTIRTHRYRFTGQLEGTGDDELFDLVADPDQQVNVAAEPAYAGAVASFGARIDDFWSRFSDPRYDLWNGGTAQAMVSRYMVFKQRYGPDWDVTLEVGPPRSD